MNKITISSRLAIACAGACLALTGLAIPAAQAQVQSQAAIDATPRFNGVWQVVKPSGELRTLEGQLPPMKPAARTRYLKSVAARRAGKTGFDPVAACQPPGLPRIFLMDSPFEILVESRQVVMTFEWNRLFRIIDLGIDHEAQNIYGETFFGWSTGKWVNGELVADTVSVLDSTLLDAAGIPHSIDMHMVERWSVSADGNELLLNLTIEDPATFTKPWKTQIRFARKPAGYTFVEDVCIERTGLNKPHN